MPPNQTSASGTAGGTEIRRALSRLAQKGATAETGDASGDGGAEIRLSGGAATAPIPASVWGEVVDNGWVVAAPLSGGDRRRWVLSASGREHLKRLMSRSEAGGRALPDQGAGRKSAESVPSRLRPGFDAEEWSIAWLARRRDRNGHQLISDTQVAAAERLRADFWFAGMTPRVTTNWSAALGGGTASRAMPGAGAEMRDSVIAARERVNRSLAAVGAGLSGLLFDVCCHLKRLEAIERERSWPERSARIVLLIALDALAHHYGLDRSNSASTPAGVRPRHWGTKDYRPAADRWGTSGRDGGSAVAAD